MYQGEALAGSSPIRGGSRRRSAARRAPPPARSPRRLGNGDLRDRRRHHQDCARVGARRGRVLPRNPVAFSWAGALATSALARLVGSSRFYTASSIDCAERFAIADLCHGHPLLVTIPDLHRARFALFVGIESGGLDLGAAHFDPRWIDAVAAMRAAGGRLVVVDPRRTETTAFADEHLAIRPGTDADLLLGMVNAITWGRARGSPFPRIPHIGAGGGARRHRPLHARPRRRAHRDRCRSFAFARAWLRARPAGFAAGHSGLTMHPRGSLAEWGVVLLNAVCGRIDARGGLLFNPGLLDLARFADVLLDRSAPIPPTRARHAPDPRRPPVRRARRGDRARRRAGARRRRRESGGHLSQRGACAAGAREAGVPRDDRPVRQRNGALCQLMFCRRRRCSSGRTAFC